MNCLTPVLLFCCTLFVFGEQKDLDSIALDYFYPRARNAASKCEDERFNHDCGVKCGGKFTCTFEKCFCLMHMKHSKHPETAKLNPRLHDVIFITDSYEINDSVEKVKELVLRQDLNPSPSERHPVLRHHIAHFCENLDTARKCIRTCMKLGKPAFCGRDHVCYCGHKYDDFHKDPVVDPAKVYAAFQDLYAKYFGPTEKNIEEIVQLENSSGE